MAKDKIETGITVKVIDEESKYYGMSGIVLNKLTQCSLLVPNLDEDVSLICEMSCENSSFKVELRPNQVTSLFE